MKERITICKETLGTLFHNHLTQYHPISQQIGKDNRNEYL